jgi:hypothetical protein
MEGLLAGRKTAFDSQHCKDKSLAGACVIDPLIAFVGNLIA